VKIGLFTDSAAADMNVRMINNHFSESSRPFEGSTQLRINFSARARESEFVLIAIYDSATILRLIDMFRSQHTHEYDVGSLLMTHSVS
jgi:hypothetical protein